ncbi:MAG: hypothetical protein KGQ52_11835 [Alphaproteobacteria bacterium]|nr:hypothetical protein [Alphaproteobacteria bacterium]
MTAAHPPRPLLALTIGITGHRTLDPAIEPALTAAIGGVLARVKADVARIAAQQAGHFADAPPQLTLISGLAAGTDQIAAEAALAQGYALAAILPFERARFAATMPAADQARMAGLLARAAHVWEAPAGAAAGDNAYVLAGDVTVAGSELLIALWDGEPERGPGGTAAVVAEAVRRGVPVVHVPSAGSPPELLWAGLDAVPPERLRLDTVPSATLDDAMLARVLAVLLTPPLPATELDIYLAETEQRRRWRAEWPLLLAATGVQPLRRGFLKAPPYRDANRADWADHAQGCADAGVPAEGLDRLEAAFAWADGLATHYAHIFRSGLVFNFFGASIAVVLALMAGLLPGAKVPLLVAELLVVGAVVLNTSIGNGRQWHRRWLDYRYLAETLRLQRSLRLIGAASPPGRDLVGPRRWTDWYALAIWQGLPRPPAAADHAGFAALTRHIVAHELDAQSAYHHLVHHRMHRLDHRLHSGGQALLILTGLIGVGTLIGLIVAYGAIKPYSLELSLLSAGLPTVGGALFGLRGAGDFAGVARRSQATAERLARVADVLRRADLSPGFAALALEEAAAIMLADLAEWRSSYADRKLAVPS